MRVRLAFVIYVTYVVAVIIAALISGSSPEIIGIPLNTLILSLGLLMTPVPAWILAVNVHTDSTVQTSG